MFDPDSNLILRWLGALTVEQRVALTVRYAKRLELLGEHGCASKIRDDPARAMGSMLFVDCAASLGLSPVELGGLLSSPQRHAMQSVAWLTLEQIRTMRAHYPSGVIGMNGGAGDEGWDEMPERILQRMNDLSF